MFNLEKRDLILRNVGLLMLGLFIIMGSKDEFTLNDISYIGLIYVGAKVAFYARILSIKVEDIIKVNTSKVFA